MRPPTELLGRVDDLREFRLGPGRDQNVRPGLGQRERRPGADPTTGPGDHGHPAVDPEPVEDRELLFHVRLLHLLPRSGKAGEGARASGTTKPRV